MSDTIPISSVKILGTKVPVKYKTKLQNESGDDLDGCYSYDKGVIDLQIGHPLTDMYSTLVHEVMHAWLDVSGLHVDLLDENAQTEEFLVSGFERAVLPIISALFKLQHGIPLTKQDRAYVIPRRSNTPAKGPGTNRPAPDSVID